MTDLVRYEVEGRVATVTIARPEKRNAMSLAVFRMLREAGEQAAADQGVRAVVVTGEGGNLSSGIDTSVFTDPSRSNPVTLDIASLQDAFTIFEQMPKPVVAAMTGVTFGAGAQLALACDLRVAADDLRFGLLEVTWGIIPDLGGTCRLPRIIGAGRAKELAFTGRTIDGAEALSWGLANRLVPAAECPAEAAAWARELAAGPPLALAAMKRLISSSFDREVTGGLERERTAQRTILASADAVEAVAARLERRAPAFAAR